jgi:hypothetical protein
VHVYVLTQGKEITTAPLALGEPSDSANGIVCLAR